MVSALLVTLIGAAVAQALITGTDFSANQRWRSQADALAQQEMERLKGLSDEQLAGPLSQTRTTTVGGTTFTITSKATFMDATGGSSCTSKVAAYFRLDSTVSWNQPGTGVDTVAVGTILTRPAAGSLLVTLVDDRGAGFPLPGVTVTAKGQTTGSAQSAITDANGCVVFSGLPGIPVQTYGITTLLGGYVDKDGNDSWPNVIANVNGTGIATPTMAPIILGAAGQITGQFFTVRNNTPQVITNVPAPSLSYFGQMSMQMQAFKTVSSAGTTITTPFRLFPFSNAGPVYTKNYQVWAGGCLQEQPKTPPTTSLPAGFTFSDYATVTPGQQVQAAVIEPAIDLAVLSNTTPVTPADVKVKFTAAATPNCNSNPSLSETLALTKVGTDTIGTTTYGVYPAPFASNAGDATGSGQITICADSQASGAWRKETSAPFNNNNFTGPSKTLTMDLVKDASSTTGQC